MLTKEQILNHIKTLAKTQGFYCGLLHNINQDSSILDKLEAQHFNDVVDLIMYIETDKLLIL